jgi:hypothetical protein
MKARVRNYGNELADNLAKEATKNKEKIYKNKRLAALSMLHEAKKAYYA